MPLTPDHASWDDYDSRLNELFPPLAPGDGVPEPEVTEAERRLGFRLPRVLRELYLRAGRRDDVNRPGGEVRGDAEVPGLECPDVLGRRQLPVAGDAAAVMAAFLPAPLAPSLSAPTIVNLQMPKRTYHAQFPPKRSTATTMPRVFIPGGMHKGR